MKSIHAKFFVVLLSFSLIGCSSESTVNTSTKEEKSKPEKNSTHERGTNETHQSDLIDPEPSLNGDDDSKDLSYDEAHGENTSRIIETDSPISRDPMIEDRVESGIEGSLDHGSSTSITETKSESSYNFHAYKNLDALLKKYVSYSGKVNYSGIKSDKTSLDKILKEFKYNYPTSGWSKNQKLAYWINAYNIFTIKLIVDNYPTSSITKITAKPWDRKFVKLGSHTYSLNNIENDIIRKKFNEPRIHFALNCASKSCPVLLNSAYTSGNLQSKLTSQTKRFLKDSSKNKFDNKKKIYISKIFEWYKEDFTKNGSTVVKFINKYRTEQLDDPKIYYTEYSWDLNN